MNRKYTVRWTDTAEKDLEVILDFIADKSIDEALNILERLRERAKNLYSMPERGRIVPELKEQGIFIYREIISSPWRIIYKINDKMIYVLAVLDSRRNMEDPNSALAAP
ncbi:MAG: type II toxin-antitoxin system RelE/ParE family toxin [Deltaproteobacteria bacterium]|nr:type II toxin-antitoxin system RelE/ParE family toxin [Deltaproteobacteria bacterium]